MSATIAPHLIEQLFAECVAAGMTQARCLDLAHKHFDGVDDETLDAAREQYGARSSDDVEIYNNALASINDDGCWVHAWVHVSAADINKTWQGDHDSDGMPCRWTNHYHCDACEVEWSDTWSCACDDECAECGDPCSPERSEFTGPDWLQEIMSNSL